MNSLSLKNLVAGFAFGLATATTASADCASRLDQSADLWVEPGDGLAALLEPECYAWQLFVALNWPGDPATQAPDKSKSLGEDGVATWELWRNVRVGSTNGVFRIDGDDPGPWLTGAALLVARPQSEFDALPLQQIARLGNPAMPQIDDASPTANETRMNQSAYEFVRDNTLYNIEGQQTAFDDITGVMNFHPDAKEIKARWRRISDTEKDRYHWVNVRLSNGDLQPFGLTALHITTKDIPNWFWATFEHIDNEPSSSNGGVPGHEGWLDSSVDAYTCPNAPVGCNKAPRVVTGTKWENYVLRGTQVDFVDSRGRPTLLASSVIERG
ncbi:MAG: hypothetical protein V7695_24070, partial [Sulfitobacter sp.]